MAYLSCRPDPELASPRWLVPDKILCNAGLANRVLTKMAGFAPQTPQVETAASGIYLS
jgi:hypothetical protein